MWGKEQEKEGEEIVASCSLTYSSVFSRQLVRIGLLPAFSVGSGDTQRIPPARIKCGPCVLSLELIPQEHNQMMKFIVFIPVSKSSLGYMSKCQELVVICQPLRSIPIQCSPPGYKSLSLCHPTSSYLFCALKFAEFFCLHQLIQFPNNPLNLRGCVLFILSFHSEVES